MYLRFTWQYTGMVSVLLYFVFFQIKLNFQAFCFQVRTKFALKYEYVIGKDNKYLRSSYIKIFLTKINFQLHFPCTLYGKNYNRNRKWICFYTFSVTYLVLHKIVYFAEKKNWKLKMEMVLLCSSLKTLQINDATSVCCEFLIDILLFVLGGEQTVRLRKSELVSTNPRQQSLTSIVQLKNSLL